MKRWIAGVMISVWCLLVLAGCGNQLEASKYTNTDFAMGTTVSEVLYGQADACEKAGGDIIELLKKIEEEQISWRKEDSEIYTMNHSEEAVEVDEDVAAWLERSLQIASDTDGALNPGVGVLAQLWDIGGDHARVPEESEIKKAMQEIDYKKIFIDGRKVTTDPDQVQVDLGAVGKGIGADKAMAYLKNQDSVTGAIISVGGSLCVYGEKPGGENWSVGVQDPRGETGEMVGVVNVKGDKFVSTSGDYEKYIEKDGKRYHHILDSATGYPSNSGLISVTIVCDSGIDSDGLSTACFVLGMEKSLKILDEYNAEAVFIGEDRNVYTTDGVDFELQNTKDYQICEMSK